MGKYCSSTVAMILLALAICSCGNSQSSSSQANDTTTVVPQSQTVKPGTVHKIVTSIFQARMENGEIVKAGKPDTYRECDAFPDEDTRIYGTNGLIDSIITSDDGITSVSVFAYEKGLLCSEKLYQNGELFYDRTFIYENGTRVNTIEDLYIAGEKTTNEYPANPAKVELINGLRIEYGDTRNDYTVTDSLGRVIKESSQSEMDDYLSIVQYSYNDKGWQTACIYEGEYSYTFSYTDIDTVGNWTRAIILCNDEPYGLIERAITYY